MVCAADRYTGLYCHNDWDIRASSSYVSGMPIGRFPDSPKAMSIAKKSEYLGYALFVAIVVLAAWAATTMPTPFIPEGCPAAIHCSPPIGNGTSGELF